MSKLGTILFLILFKIQFVESENSEAEQMPLLLKNTGQLLRILKKMVESTEGPNSTEEFTEFTKSPRKNGLISKPSTIKAKIKYNRIKSFNPTTHELFLELIIHYFWADERLETQRQMRLPLPYEKVEMSPFWRPMFDFKNASIIKTTNDKFIHMNRKVI